MRILALNYEFPPLGGGAGNATAHISRELVRLGCQVAVLTSGFRGLQRREETEGYTVHRVPVFRRRVEQCSPFEMASFVASAVVPAISLCREFDPDILHVYFGVPTGPLGLAVKMALGTPYLLSLRGGDVPGFLPESLSTLHRLIAPLNRRVWEGASVVVANSEGLQTLAQRSLSSGTVAMASNGVDLEAYSPPQQPREDGVFRLLFVGRLVEQKGVRYVLQALPRIIAATEARVELAIVGSGSEEASLRRLAEGLGLRGHVRFHGWAPRGEMPQHYRNASVFVFPSFEEGMPNVVLEAMASGLPIVTTDIYGNRDLVVDGENGFLAPVADAEALGSALVRLATAPQLCRDMGCRSRTRAQSYGWGQTARAYLKLSEDTLSKMGRRPGAPVGAA